MTDTSLLTKRYEIAESPPPPMASDEYVQRVTAEWRSFVTSAEARTESNVQRFLETHPCLVPMAFGAAPWSSVTHGVVHAAVISQPTLNGLAVRQPDFMWIAKNSAFLCPVLVEIETPYKKWFTESGTPSAELTLAQSQLAEWRMWFESPGNRTSFLEQYEIEGEIRRRTLHPIYVLVHGSSAEFEGKEEKNRLRAHLQRKDEHLMTFDRLSVDRNALDYMTIRRRPQGGFEAKAMPPTIRLGPLMAPERARILSKPAVAEEIAWASPERRAFLAERFPYWDGLASTPGGIGAHSPGDVE